MISSDSLISVAVVERNEQARIERFVENLNRMLAEQYQFYEIILIDNASNDGTDRVITSKLRQISNVRLIRLSRIYSIDTAVTAALDAAIGDYVILVDMESDLSLIPQLMNQAMEGSDIVVVRRNLTQMYNPADRWLGRMLYGFASRLLGYEVVLEDGFMRLFSRRVVNALTQVRNRRRYLKHLGKIVGFRQGYIVSNTGSPITNVKRIEKLGSLISLVVSNSIAPLRFAALLGLVASILSLFYVFYIVIVTIIREGQLAEGWLTSTIMMTTMFLMLFIILTILAEYIGRLLEESKDEPLYFIEYEEHSTVSSYSRTIEQEKLNIVQ